MVKCIFNVIVFSILSLFFAYGVASEKMKVIIKSSTCPNQTLFKLTPVFPLGTLFLKAKKEICSKEQIMTVGKEAEIIRSGMIEQPVIDNVDCAYIVIPQKSGLVNVGTKITSAGAKFTINCKKITARFTNTCKCE